MPSATPSQLSQLTCLLIGIALSTTASLAQTQNPVPQKEPEPSRAAVQTIYRDGVPHTEKTGKRRFTYDPQKSFFQIAMWGTPLSSGAPYGYVYDWKMLKNAGFNTAWTFFNMPPIDALKDGESNDMQVVLMGTQHGSELLHQVADNETYRKRLLGLMWRDEPTTTQKMDEMQKDFDDFKKRISTVSKILPDVPVFVNDAHAFIDGEPFRTWWLKWARGGDLTCQDNYPIRAGGTTSIGNVGNPPGISESISMAVAAVDQQKPVWAIIGTFGDRAADNFPTAFRYSTPTQLFGQVYSAVIHGATGIIYFAWDSYILRYTTNPEDVSSCNFGISPDPLLNGYVLNAQENAPKQGIATPEMLKQSKDLWAAVAGVNSELQTLAPVILSPTVKSEEMSYTVALSNLSAPDNPKIYAPNPIRTILKRDTEGRYVLLAVNLDNRNMDATFSFSRTFAGIKLIFEDESSFDAKSNESKFKSHFKPFERKVFILTPSTSR